MTRTDCVDEDVGEGVLEAAGGPCPAALLVLLHYAADCVDEDVGEGVLEAAH